MPLAPVVAGEPTTLPPPAVTVKVTSTPDTGMPEASRTITLGGSPTFPPAGAAWVVSDTATMETGGPARAVAVNTIGLLLTPFASTRAARVCAPAVRPSRQLPTVARPWALVTARPLVT